MTTHEDLVTNPLYWNWVKGGLGLKYLTEGLESFVDDTLKSVQTGFLDDIRRNTPGLEDVKCTECTTANALPCPTPGMCNLRKRGGICNYHDKTDELKKSKPCPNSICDKIVLKIGHEHRHSNPSWKSTNARNWCTNHFEIGKCFISIKGYEDKTATSETDSSGILHMAMNCLSIQNQLDVMIDPPNDIMSKLLKARNSIFHSASCTLTKEQLDSYIDEMVTLLEDKKTLLADPKARTAVLKLNKLKNGLLRISPKDELDVRNEALRAVEEKQNEAILKIENKQEEVIDLINDTHETERATMSDEISLNAKTMADQCDALRSSIQTLKSTQDTLEGNIENHEQRLKAMTQTFNQFKTAQEQTETKLATLRKDYTDFREDIKVTKTVEKQHKNRIEYLKRKQMMKTALVRTYQKSELLSASFFPLVPNKDMKIHEFYVKPYMKHKGANVDSYKEIFQHYNHLNTNIYVVGDAGSGKTSFCQNMISTWCRVQSEMFENMSDDQQAMTQFDHLFYVSLREAIEENDIEEMIKNQLLDEEYHEQVSEVLKHEKCLVILDGLDEWGRKNTKAKLGYNKSIPGRKTSDYLTVLTTTRPWKLDAIQLKQTQIDARVELLGIEETSSKQLIQIMLTYINKDKDKKCHMIMEDFLIELAKKKLEHFMAIPVILKQLICLWSAGKDLGQTPTKIYCQMMELLLELAQNRLDTTPAYKQKKDEWVNSAIQLPSCFEGNDTCQEFKPLIFLLSKLAFNAILIKNKESALVFKRKQAEIHGMTESDIDICLNIGILSQSGIIQRGKSQRKLSFLHKSYHDFLAALFIALDLGECDQHVQRIQQHCTTLSELMEMENLIQFIGGMCTSDTLCALLSYIKSMDIGTRYLQIFIKNGIKEGWCCSHDNEHLCTNTIDINPEDKPEHVELLCQVNIKHLKDLTIRTTPTSQCIEYLQQVHTLWLLTIQPSIALSSRSSRLSPISEDIMNDLVPHVQNMFSILTKPQLTKELSSSTSCKSTPISEDDLNDTFNHYNNIVRILFERGVVIDPSSSSSSSSIYMVGENDRNDFRQQMQNRRDIYTQRNVTFEPWSSISSRSMIHPECEQHIYSMIEIIQNDIDRRTERESASVTFVSSPSTTRSCNISEDILYDLIQNNSHTLEFLTLYNITFRSKTKLFTLLHSLPRLRKLYMYNTTLPQQLLDSLQDLKRPDAYIGIGNRQILADRKCTE